MPPRPGLSVRVTQERTQQANRAIALQRLTAKLLVVLEEQRAAELAELRGDLVKAEWGQQVRGLGRGGAGAFDQAPRLDLPAACVRGRAGREGRRQPGSCHGLHPARQIRNYVLHPYK
jgi:hypothetical protein